MFPLLVKRQSETSPEIEQRWFNGSLRTKLWRSSRTRNSGGLERRSPSVWRSRRANRRHRLRVHCLDRGRPNAQLHAFRRPIGQSWLQLSELALAFVLSALIGLEREVGQKSAGLRTYTLVGTSSALIMLVSKYGFTDIIENGRVVLDPSRVAAQIVSGIRFIGGGVIFLRKDIVRGSTTASILWLTAAVGMAAGAGLPILAFAVTCGHFIVVFVFPSIERNCRNHVGAAAPAHLLLGAPRRFERDSCRLHQSRILGEPCASCGQAVPR